MGSIQTSAMLPQEGNLLQKPSVAKLESKIAATVAEMDFYHKLLSWLLFSCHEDKRYAVETLKKELSDLRKGGFSVLKEGIERLKNEEGSVTGRPDLYSDIAWLQMYFNQREGALQSLKSKIHERFSDFTHVCIW